MTIESELRVAALVLRNLPHFGGLYGGVSEIRVIDEAEAESIAKAIEAALELIEQSQWQAIETHTELFKDVQVYCSDTKEQLVAFLREDGNYQFACGSHETMVCSPSHWMPIQKPPTEN